MTMPEVIEAARRLYPDMGELKLATARTWVTRGLIPSATRQAGQGRGKGRVGDYPDTTPYEMAVAAFLKYALQTPFKETAIARARQVWVVNDRSATGREAEELLPGLLILASLPTPRGLSTPESVERAVDVLIYGALMEKINRGIDIRFPVRAEFDLWHSAYPSIDLRLSNMALAEKDQIIVRVTDLWNRPA